jgi:ABC-2 type transport system ATP-binding protein/lipopolysaccharide transport system ATP-binding protein
MYKEDTKIDYVHALKGINLTLEDGDRLAIIGRNGAGKSTLLRVMAGFMIPTIGTIKTEGNITPLFSIATGMDIEMTGYQNIYYMGRLIGLSRSEMDKRIPDIEEFTELSEFLKLPVRSYSAGMRVRLAFAIATCIKPEILIMDEAIGAGDAHFVDKASARANSLYNSANIMVVASHAASLLKSLCNKAILMDHGKIIASGTLDEIQDVYNKIDALAAAA